MTYQHKHTEQLPALYKVHMFSANHCALIQLLKLDFDLLMSSNHSTTNHLIIVRSELQCVCLLHVALFSFSFMCTCWWMTSSRYMHCTFEHNSLIVSGEPFFLPASCTVTLFSIMVCLPGITSF